MKIYSMAALAVAASFALGGAALAQTAGPAGSDYSAQQPWTPRDANERLVRLQAAQSVVANLYRDRPGYGVGGSGFGGVASIGSTAIGNIASWTSKTYGAADGINFQTNTASLQKSVTNVNNASFGKVSVGAVAAGNIGNIGL